MKKLLMMGLVALSLSACAASPADGDAGYQKWMQGVVEKIKAKPDYKRLPLDTKQSVEAFVEVDYKFYKGDITVEQYKMALLSKYPGYAETINWLAAQHAGHGKVDR